MKYLIVIDVQNDFVTGVLGTQQARDMLPRLLKKMREFEGEIWMTRDCHDGAYLDTQEGKHLPVPHCVAGTEGWRFPEEVEQLRMQCAAPVYEKTSFGSVSLVTALKQACERGGVESVELVGLCTDICVVSNALMIKAVLPELPVYVDADCCAGVTPERHEAALTVMESCQIEVRRAPV